MPNGYVPKKGLAKELDRSTELRHVVVQQLERVLDRYQEGRKQLALLTQTEEEEVKVGRLHTKMIASLLNENADEWNDEDTGNTNEVLHLQCRDLLSHQRDLRESLQRELELKRAMLLEKQQSNVELKGQIGTLERKSYRAVKFDKKKGVTSDASSDDYNDEPHAADTPTTPQSPSKRKSIHIDKLSVLQSHVPDDISHDDWLATLRLKSKVTLSSVLGCNVTNKGELLSKVPKHMADAEKPSSDVELQEEEMAAVAEFEKLTSLREMYTLSQEMNQSIRSSPPYTQAEKYAVVHGIESTSPPPPLPSDSPPPKQRIAVDVVPPVLFVSGEMSPSDA